MPRRFIGAKPRLPKPIPRVSGPGPEAPTTNVSADAMENGRMIQTRLGAPEDLILREFRAGTAGPLCMLVCLDGMVDKVTVQDEVVKPLQRMLEGAWQASGDAQPQDGGGPSAARGKAVLKAILDEGLSAFEVQETTSLDDALLAVLSGDTALFVDGSQAALTIGSRGYKLRAISEPNTEAIIRGPKEGFTEDLRTNTALLRRRMSDPSLRFVSLRLGQRSKRRSILAYIDGIANPKLIEEVKRRLASIDIDAVEGSGYIESFVADSFLTPFPLIMNTERPDKVSSALFQGRAALLVDGDPFALVMPITFASSLQSPEDYYQNWMVASLTRLLRLTAAFLATFLPALYIALLEYHHGMLPSQLAFSIAGSREGVPFPAVVEAFAMEATLELLREAGLRLPKPIGQTIGIVGGLVIGEAAVSAGIVSPIMVIVVSITAISSFALPSYSFGITLRMIRFAIMLSAALFGLYGVVLAYIALNIHLVNLRTFGIPYTTPFAPTLLRDWKDVILRAPTPMMRTRPDMLQPGDSSRLHNPKSGR